MQMQACHIALAGQCSGPTRVHCLKLVCRRDKRQKQRDIDTCRFDRFFFSAPARAPGCDSVHFKRREQAEPMHKLVYRRA
jgi:hypothetical protein